MKNIKILQSICKTIQEYKKFNKFKAVNEKYMAANISVPLRDKKKKFVTRKALKLVVLEQEQHLT